MNVRLEPTIVAARTHRRRARSVRASEMRSTVASRTRLPVVPRGRRTPPRGHRHHQKPAKPHDERLVKPPHLEKPRVGVFRTRGTKTRILEVASQRLEAFLRETIVQY